MAHQLSKREAESLRSCSPTKEREKAGHLMVTSYLGSAWSGRDLRRPGRVLAPVWGCGHVTNGERVVPRSGSTCVSSYMVIVVRASGDKAWRTLATPHGN